MQRVNSDMLPFLSVVVPVYNVQKYLPMCIESILKQSYSNFELILVNDGSTDRSYEICEYYALLDNRVIIINKENEGLIAARKTGVKNANGEYITFVDSDDWIDYNMYQEMVDKGIEYDADIIICDIVAEYANYAEPIKQFFNAGYYERSDIEKILWPKMLFSGSFYEFGFHPAVVNKLFKNNILKNRIFEIKDCIKLGEDAAISFPCLLDANSIYYMKDAPFYHYRKTRQGSICNSYKPNLFDETLILLEHLNTCFAKVNNKELDREINYYAVFLAINIIHNEFPGNGKSFYEKYKYLSYNLNNGFFINVFSNIELCSLTSLQNGLLALLRKKKLFILMLLLQTRFLYRCLRGEIK